jgi:hypothetical protein
LSGSSRKRIEEIIGNRRLASDIHTSISSALHCPFVYSLGGKTAWAVFKRSLYAAIRDIETHPKGKLFRRLIEFGPHIPDDPEAPNTFGKKDLSDPECEVCVEFIYSHMVNRFKGELAELLALGQCVKLIHQLQEKSGCSLNMILYWGDAVQQRRRQESSDRKEGRVSESFTKGADGLIAEHTSAGLNDHISILKILGVVEVKSMNISRKKIIEQIDCHIDRLQLGVRLGEREWPPACIVVAQRKNGESPRLAPVRILVAPSNWRLSRDWSSIDTDRGREISFPAPILPSAENKIDELESDLWRITLAWSQEALAQAAYKMTFWYMSQVGRHIYQEKSLPKEWEFMTPEQAGRNAIKMMLYYIPLRHISKRHERLSTRLYNVYSFGFQAGVDSKEMLWPQDFPDA